MRVRILRLKWWSVREPLKEQEPQCQPSQPGLRFPKSDLEQVLPACLLVEIRPLVDRYSNMKQEASKCPAEQQRKSGNAYYKGYASELAGPLDSIEVSTRALIITALATGLVILVAFAAQVLIAV